MEVNNVLVISGLLAALSLVPVFFMKAKREYFFFFFFVNLIFWIGAGAFYYATRAFTITPDVFQMVSELKTAPYLGFAVILMMVSMFAMLGVFPFHYWVTNVVASEPSWVATYMVVGMRTVVLFLMMIIMEPLSSFWDSFFEVPIFIFAIATMTVANLNIYKTSDVKGLFANSSIAYVGFTLLLFPSFLIAESDSNVLILYLIMTFFLIHIGAFLLLEMTKNVSLEGIGKKSPIIGFLLVFFIASIAGLPPTVGFMARLFIVRSLVIGGSLIVLALFAVNMLMMVVSSLTPIRDIYLKEYPKDADEVVPNVVLTIIIVLIACAVIYIGLMPDVSQTILSLANSAFGLYK